MILLGSRLEAPEDDHHDDSDDEDDDDLPPSLSPDIGPRHQPTSGAGRTSAPQCVMASGVNKGTMFTFLIISIPNCFTIDEIY